MSSRTVGTKHCTYMEEKGKGGLIVISKLPNLTSFVIVHRVSVLNPEHIVLICATRLSPPSSIHAADDGGGVQIGGRGSPRKGRGNVSGRCVKGEIPLVEDRMLFQVSAS